MKLCFTRLLLATFFVTVPAVLVGQEESTASFAKLRLEGLELASVHAQTSVDNANEKPLVGKMLAIEKLGSFVSNTNFSSAAEKMLEQKVLNKLVSLLTTSDQYDPVAYAAADALYQCKERSVKHLVANIDESVLANGQIKFLPPCDLLIRDPIVEYRLLKAIAEQAIAQPEAEMFDESLDVLIAFTGNIHQEKLSVSQIYCLKQLGVLASVEKVATESRNLLAEKMSLLSGSSNVYHKEIAKEALEKIVKEQSELGTATRAGIFRKSLETLGNQRAADREAAAQVAIKHMMALKKSENGATEEDIENLIKSTKVFLLDSNPVVAKTISKGIVEFVGPVNGPAIKKMSLRLRAVIFKELEATYLTDSIQSEIKSSLLNVLVAVSQTDSDQNKPEDETAGDGSNTPQAPGSGLQTPPASAGGGDGILPPQEGGTGAIESFGGDDTGVAFLSESIDSEVEEDDNEPKVVFFASELPMVSQLDQSNRKFASSIKSASDIDGVTMGAQARKTTVRVPRDGVGELKFRDFRGFTPPSFRSFEPQRNTDGTAKGAAGATGAIPLIAEESEAPGM